MLLCVPYIIVCYKPFISCYYMLIDAKQGGLKEGSTD